MFPSEASSSQFKKFDSMNKLFSPDPLQTPATYNSMNNIKKIDSKNDLDRRVMQNEEEATVSIEKQNKNFILEQIADNENENKCKFHSKEITDFFCFDPNCQENLACSECLIAEMHLNHEIHHKNKMEDAWLDWLHSNSVNIDYSLKKMRLNFERQNKFISELKNNESFMKERVSQFFDDLRNIINLKENELKVNLEESFNQLINEKNTNLAEINTKIQCFEDLINKLNYAENSSNLSMIDYKEIFDAIKIVNVSEDELKQNCGIDEKISQIKLKFNEIVENITCIKKDLSKINFENEILNIKDREKQTELENLNFSPNKTINPKAIKPSSTNPKKKIKEKFEKIVEIFDRPSYLNSNKKKQNLLDSFTYRTPNKKTEFLEEYNMEETERPKNYEQALNRQKLKYLTLSNRIIKN